ncbi:uncharacterized protein LOC142665026 [Rhinoderma darwinii]|uniref:uncharacterized protein LOC142665026 n=1 Tax=Rhinoderma darwinii TaxID=43563 RepID=UPI003F670831
MNPLIILYATAAMLSLKFKDIVGHGVVVRPAVTFTPNWGKVFTGESVTITCVVESVGESQIYLWYKDSEQLQIEEHVFTIGYTKIKDTGDYQCQKPTGEISECVRLEVIYGYLILQVPALVYEGDDVLLRCYSWPGYSVRRTLFYKDEMEFNPSDRNNGLLLKNIKKDMAGKYRCVKKADHSSVATYSDESFIHVRELFSNPEIKVTPNPALEGDEMTLTCDMNLSPLRQTTGLLFAFYKDGQNFQGFGQSNNYGVRHVHVEDSTNYSCVVKTVSSSVKKESLASYIQVHELFSNPLITVSPNQMTEGDHMTLTCDTIVSQHRQATELLFAFYVGGWEVQGFNSSNKHKIISVQLKDSGNYSCNVKTSTNSVRKRSQEINILVQELFSNPLITVSANQMTEGDHMTLTCDTTVSQHRQATELLFAFYIDGWKVQGFNSLNKHEIPSVQLKDSGNYSCEVKPSTSNVRKRSQEMNILVQGKKSKTELLNIVRLAISSFLFLVCWVILQAPPYVYEELFTNSELQMTPHPIAKCDHMSLTCDTSLTPQRQNTELQFGFYRDRQKLQDFGSSDIYEIWSTQLEDSGHYSCKVRTSTNSVMKMSRKFNIEGEGKILGSIVFICPAASSPSIMSAKTSMLLFLSIIINVGHSSRPVVTFTPNTQKIFTNEPISMTCDVGPTAQKDQKYDWFKTGTHVYNGKTYAIKSAEISHSGSYQCFSQHASDSRRLDVSNGWVILQAPHQVYEGDNLTLRCHHYPGYPAGQTIFYKDNGVIQNWRDNDLFHIAMVDMEMSGTYRCAKQVKHHLIFYKHGDEDSIFVRELFTTPTIKVTLNSISKETNMTLTCSTSLHPSRQNTQLRFAFYREERIIQEFSVNDTYEVYIVHLEDSGKYSCEVETLDGRVRKKSAEQLIQIEGFTAK